MDEMTLDGNALGGVLGEVFALEVTAAMTTCAGCGASREMARVDVYVRAPGVVARCPDCQQVLLRLVRGRGRYWLDLTGIRTLELEAPEL